MSRKSQNGFALVVLLIIVILAIIGGTGYFVWHSQQATDKALIDANTASNGNVGKPDVKSFEDCKKLATSKVLETYPEQCVTKDGKTFVQKVAYLGKRVTSAKGGFSMIVLNGWEVGIDTTFDYLFQYHPERLVYKSAKAPKTTTTDASGVGGYVPGIMIAINKYQDPITTGDAFSLNDGTAGICKSSTTKPSESEGLLDAAQGTYINKSCMFTKGKTRVFAQYSYFEHEPLDTRAVEWAFKTIQIN